jgi:superoxide dismutase, Cu-Zn family
MGKTQFIRWIWLYPVLGLLAMSCDSGRTASKNATAKAEVSGYLPNTLGGMLLFSDQGEKGMRIHGEIAGLMPNREYAIHIHEQGNCSNPEASGGHFDPAKSGKHGMPGMPPDQRHAGDLPNIKSDDGGKAEIDVTSHLLAGQATEFSVIGKSIVINSEKDDYKSQPAGGSGERIGCGVIESAGG